MGQKVDIKGLHNHLGGLVSEWLLRQKAKRGEIPGCVRVGSRYIFDLDVIEDWFHKGQAKPEQPQKQEQSLRPSLRVAK